MNSNQLLDAVKAHTGAASDYALAKKIFKVDVTSIREMRDRGLSDARAIQCADLIGLNRGEVLADIHAERAKEPAVRKAWQEVAKSLRASAAALLIALGLISGTAPEPAGAAQGPSLIMSNRRRRSGWLAAAAGILAFLGVSNAALSDNGDWSLQINGQSWHNKAGTEDTKIVWGYGYTTTTKKFNHDNWGAGLEYEQRTEGAARIKWSAGFLTNSMNDQSDYAGAAVVYRLGSAWRIDAGLFLGAMTYPTFKPGPFAVALPTLSIGTRRAGFNLVVIPPLDGIPTAVLFQARAGF